MGEYWIQTHSGKYKIHWLVDTGSPRNFVSQTTANWLTNKLGKNVENNATKVGEFRCFNNNKIKKQHPQHQFIIRKHGRTKL